MNGISIRVGNMRESAVRSGSGKGQEEEAGTDQGGLVGRYHAWESLAMKYLSKLDPRTIKASHTSFNKMVRP
jgi:hypothetical protein